jgi:pantothenate kinase
MTPCRAIDLESLVRIVGSRAGAGRTVTAVVGAPGSGKSTLADRLEAGLNGVAPGTAAVLPMDGYHYDDGVLVARGIRGRKGAPDTFDVGGLLHMLGRLRRDDEDEVAVPLFDRGLEISRAGARLIPRSVRHIVVEGNYLLLGAAPWSALHPLFDVTVAAVVPEAVLRDRLTRRWVGYGLSPEEVLAKVESIDLPNGRRVASDSVPAEFTIDN